MAKLTTRSTNGITWTGLVGSGAYEHFIWVTAGYYIGVNGDKIYTSSDGITWFLSYDSTSMVNFVKAAWNNDALLTVVLGNVTSGNARSAVFDLNSYIWTEYQITVDGNPLSQTIMDLKCDGTTFWACTYNGQIIKSINGSTWTTVTVPGGITNLYGIASKNKPLV